MLRRVLLIGVVACLLVGASSAYLAGYGYYQDATVNNTGSNLTNYQVMFVVNTSSGTSSGTTLYLNSHSEADLDDLRFTSTSDTVYDYWIESTSNPYTVWVECPTLNTGNTTIRVQYGNAGASATSNGTNTFGFFDDFLGTSLDTTTRWTLDTTAGTPTVSVSGGILTFTCDSNLEAIKYKAKYGTTSKATSVMARMSIHTCSGNDAEIKIMSDNAYCHAFGYNSAPAGTRPTRAFLHELVTWGANIESSLSYDTYYNLEVSYNPDTDIVYARKNGGAWSTWTSRTTNPTTFVTYIGAYSGTSAVAVGSYDWVLVRNYTSTEPTIPAWAAESSTATTPVAAFSSNVTSGANPLTVLFTDASTNTPTSWAWSFDDGGANSTSQNPIRTFSTAGLYTIILTATNDAGSDSEEKVDYIQVCDIPTAAFSANATTICLGSTIAFTDSSTNTPTSWVWQWGDGTANGTTQNPTHTYTNAGVYNVTLTATNCGGSDNEVKTSYITVNPPAPVANFAANRTTGAPGVVAFTDSSTNTPTSWVWQWGDGTANGTTQNPTHTYAAGTYTVILTAANSCGSDGETKTNYITITNPPVAAFNANVTTGAVPLTVLFTDSSTNTPTSWAWDVDYNSGTDYATQNATHTYAVAGTYSVRLNATNAGGSDDEIKNNYIVAYTLYPFPGCSVAPKDVDADGYYEDINGNSRKDWSDLILFFTHLTWAKNTEPNALFDFANDGGTITFTDVNRLYPEVSAAV